MEFKNLDQNKTFIKNEAKRLNISTNAAYQTYYARDLLERLSKLNFGTLVVKGSFSEFVHLGELTRPVLDIDLTSNITHNYPLLLLYQAIYDSKDNVISYDVRKIPYQTPNGVYKIPITASIKYPKDNRKINVSVNVDFKENNNIIFENQYKEVKPIFKGDKTFYINTPSYEEHLAEKLYIILSNQKQDVLNTRVKDFYDVFKLYGQDYDSEKFTLYFNAMLMMYGIDIYKLSTDFLNRDFIDKHKELWEKMKIKYEFIDKDVNLDDVVFYTKAVLANQIQKINHGIYVDAAENLVKSKSKNFKY